MNICNKIESLQYNAALAITGAIRGSSKEKLFQELGFEYLSSRRWLRKLCLFHKTVVNKSPNYLCNYVSTVDQSYQTRRGDKFLHMCCRTEYYKVFKNSLLIIIRLSPNSLFNVSDRLGIKLLTRLRLGLSHLSEHNFNHNFQDAINPLCPCSLESESTTHFFLRCQNFTDLRKCLMNNLIKIDSCILTLDEKSLTKLLLYIDDRYDCKTNIILASINFIHSSKRFDGQLM